MIHRIKKKKLEGGLTKDLMTKQEIDYDYSNVIVKKPWGYEYLIYKNEQVAIWMLQIVRKRKTSMHCHPRKKTGLVLLAGNAKCYHQDGEIELNQLDGIVIEAEAFHSTEAFNPLPIQPQSENGIWVMEIETPPLKNDLVRLNDAYGRAGTSYEGVDNVVFEPKECFKLQEPGVELPIIKKKFMDCTFTLRKGAFMNGGELPGSDALVSIVGKDKEGVEPGLEFGEVMTYKQFSEITQDADLAGYTILTVEKSQTLAKVSDYIFSYIADLGVKDVFAVCGGGAMHLVDSLGKNNDLNYIATHHEQAAAMAAEGYSRISGKPGVVLVTSGPGGTNTITGLYGGWIDSIPMIFISGQVTTDTLISDTGLRQFGIQEANIVELVKPVTKYAVTVTDPNMIKYHLQKAHFLAVSGRPGPVWLDIPLDVQSKLVDLEKIAMFDPKELGNMMSPEKLEDQVADCLRLMQQAKRPVLIFGYGVRLAGAERELLNLIETLNIPAVSSWTASDMVSTDHDYYVGRSGIMGDRASNFAIQNSDLVLIIGSRMSIPQVGYNYKDFARGAKKIMVDIDAIELKKPSLNVDLAIMTDAKLFLSALLAQIRKRSIALKTDDWLKKCQGWKAKYPVVLPEYKGSRDKVNSFYFIDVLSEKLGGEAIVVTDMGTSFTCTMQTFRTKQGQRLFTSSGHASMGFGLPGAIGACLANGRKKTICISGDGALQMNLQELQTIVHYKLPILLFVLNNQGYLTIKLMQQNHFGRYVGSESSSGLSCPDIIRVAAAYGIKSEQISNHDELRAKIDGVLAEPGPFICEIIMPEDQPLIPRVSSLKKPDGTIISKPLEDLYPFLSRKEFLSNMIVKPKEVLEG